MFTFSVVSLALSSKIQIFFCCLTPLPFDSSEKTQKSGITRGSYELFMLKGEATLVWVGPFLRSDTSSLFQPFLSP
jgi:hypothetical protein